MAVSTCLLVARQIPDRSEGSEDANNRASTKGCINDHLSNLVSASYGRILTSRDLNMKPIGDMGYTSDEQWIVRSILLAVEQREL
eukprot:1373091-Amphidinium_carterae.1